ncbi:MAG: hypothetical protein D3904_08245 [Candidatus Electrothrix sp. EH2]|nr:hypothetical protein [Candidatus Electrothrix sp. EH2]
MYTKSKWYIVQLVIFLIFFLVLPCQGKENEKKAVGMQQDLVWSQSDGLRYEIFSSSKKGDEWTSPVKITDNNANNLHPVLDIGADGTKWLFWSAVRPDGISIEYAVFQENSWSDPQKFSVQQHSAITPSVLADKEKGVWLVWAGNDGGNDDIYVSRYDEEKWSDPRIIHAPNEVPDIKPEIAYNDKGKIEVSWIGFRDNSYKKLASVYTDRTGWSPEQEQSEPEQDKEQEEKEQEIVLPSFLPADSQFILKIY